MKKNPEKKTQEIDLEQFDSSETYSEFSGWESVGFHRPLAKELWEVAIELINETFAVFMVAYLIPLLNPYPEIQGYRGLANGLFVLVYTVFDTGTNFGLGRFISEYRIKNPRKMMEYVNFFIRYQMITGIIQVTVLTWYIFQVVIHGSYGYLAWILLLEMQKQYPGMLGIFKSVLEGMQHYSMTQLMKWVQNRGIELFLNAGFILWGRAYGAAHPEMGIIMGMAIFGVIGNYIDDVIMLFVSGYYLNKILKKNIGYSLMDSLTFKIGKDVKMNALKYGIPGSIVPIITTAVNTYILLAYSDNIPGYITWSALVIFGTNMVGIIDQFTDFSTGTLVAEAYMNKKKDLAEFYISYSMKWRYFFRWLMGMSIAAAIPYLRLMVQENPALAPFELGFYFLIPGLIKRMLEPLFGLMDPVMVGAKAINQYNVIRVIEEAIKLLSVYLIIYVWEIQDKGGINTIVFLIVFQNYIPYLIKTALCYLYINKKILRIRIYWMSTVIIPFVSTLPIFLFARIWLITGFPPPMQRIFGFNLAASISTPILFLTAGIMYFPLTVLLGGWDDYQLFTFQEAVKLSGPSKIFFKPLLKLLKKCAVIGMRIGTHGRFPIPFEKAHKEIQELMELKRATKNV